VGSIKTAQGDRTRSARNAVRLTTRATNWELR